MQNIHRIITPDEVFDLGKYLVSVADACHMLDISKETLYKMLRKGQLDSIKIGKARKICVASILIFLEENDPNDYRPGRRPKRGPRNSDGFAIPA